MGNSEQKCKTCRWFREFSPLKEEPGHGRCFLNPPTAFLKRLTDEETEYKTEHVWSRPKVFELDECSNHTPKDKK